ncbi:hypothetical protein ACFY5D_16755 [Paeniglutamicibacter sp. NPDC012692]|uniref:hypothetical protein n=1 Tax=Paeniglutamicibacter sp. NPDC012692 TaxID=3364388 RepID=UPI0036C03D32
MHTRQREPRGAMSTARYRLTCAQLRVERLKARLAEDMNLIASLTETIKNLDEDH